MTFRSARGVAPVALSFFFLSCSFNYNEGLDTTKAYPDMEMTGVTLSRYEDARVSMTLNAGILELYNSDNVWAGTDVSFTQYSRDGDGKIESEASAGIALIDDEASLYSLGNDVRFFVVKDDLSVEAADLQWAKKTNRLCGSDSGEVEIAKGDGTLLRGTGFYADTLSREYWFAGVVDGALVKKDDDEPPSDGDAP